MKSITSMYVNCSLQIKNFNKSGVAASDCCGQSATTAVIMADGKKMWRCNYHRGQRYSLNNPKGYEIGPVVWGIKDEDVDQKEKEEEMPLNDTERSLLRGEAERAYSIVQKTQRRLTEAEEHLRAAREAHQEAAARWQSLSRHYDPVDDVDSSDSDW